MPPPVRDLPGIQEACAAWESALEATETDEEGSAGPPARPQPRAAATKGIKGARLSPVPPAPKRRRVARGRSSGDGAAGAAASKRGQQRSGSKPAADRGTGGAGGAGEGEEGHPTPLPPCGARPSQQQAVPPRVATRVVVASGDGVAAEQTEVTVSARWRLQATQEQHQQDAIGVAACAYNLLRRFNPAIDADPARQQRTVERVLFEVGLDVGESEVAAVLRRALVDEYVSVPQGATAGPSQTSGRSQTAGRSQTHGPSQPVDIARITVQRVPDDEGGSD